MPLKRNTKFSRKKTSKLSPDLRPRLESLYERFHRAELVSTDPLGLIARDLASEDFEIVSFLVAGLSYGRVAQIQASSRNLILRLARLGSSPEGRGLAQALKELPDELAAAELEEALVGWVHRLNTPADLKAVLYGLSRLLREHGSLSRVFQTCHADSPKLHLESFCASLNEAFLVPSPIVSSRAPKTWAGTGPQWFAPSPASGGTSKRLLMWLRWMIRRDEVDPGTWRDPSMLDSKKPSPDPSRLFVPVDTHIFKWAKQNKITRYAGPQWKVVEEVTEAFRAIEPTDPVKFDFSVCHAGMEAFRTKPIKSSRSA